AELLENEWQTPCDVFSVTSFCELAREAEEVRRWNRLHPLQTARRSHITTQLRPGALCVAATDYVRAYPQLIAQYIEGEYITLGTDGFGRSDTRQALRRFFEVDRHSVVIAALDGLARAGRVPATTVARAIEQYGLNTDAGPPWQQ